MTRAEVRLWGTRIGAVVWSEDDRLASFEYDPGFRHSGVELRAGAVDNCARRERELYAEIQCPLAYRPLQIAQRCSRREDNLVAEDLGQDRLRPSCGCLEQGRFEVELA